MRYRARGYAMGGNRIAIATDHPEDLVEVYPPSRGKVDLGGLTVERCPPAPAMGGFQTVEKYSASMSGSSLFLYRPRCISDR